MTSGRAGSSRGGGSSAGSFEVEFWGVRGSLPSPGSQTQRYGGNTPCLEVRCGAQRLIFDLGSGARLLGERLVASGRAINASVFVSHYHYDHLQGLPFFLPIYNPRNRFHVYGAIREGRTPHEAIGGQMVPPYFPVSVDVFRAQLEYRKLEPGTPVKVGGARVTPFELNHPGGSLAFRVDYRGRSLVYATDSEYGSDRDAAFSDFARDVDLLIYDAMYTEDEYEGRVGPRRVGWGHSTWNSAILAADACRAKSLVLFHHDPTRDDASLEKVLRQARKLRPGTLAAREAQVIKLR